MTIFNNALAGAAGQAGGASTPSEIERSLRFNSDDSAYLNRTPTSNGNRKKFTLSCWVKKTVNGVKQGILNVGATSGANGLVQFYFGSNDSLYINARSSSGISAISYTDAFYRDNSAWYHIVFTVDTAQSAFADQQKVYVNGVQVDSWGYSTALTQDTELLINSTTVHHIGTLAISTGSLVQNLSGYLADCYIIDGQALTPNSFGTFDTDGVWQPIEYTGTYGTNGFHLDFSDNSTVAALGTDTSGNNHTWTVNNISVTPGADNDSLFDSPTNGTQTDTGAGGEVSANYFTWNSSAPTTGTPVYSDGNLYVSQPAQSGMVSRGNMAVSSGKWYWEIEVATGSVNAMIGISDAYARYNLGGYGTFQGIYYYQTNGNLYGGLGRAATTATAYGSAYAVGDTIGVALDMDNQTLQFYTNSTGEGSISLNLAGLTIYPSFNNGGGVGRGWLNAGQRPFTHGVPSGFKALCTTNVSETITNPSEHFDVKTWAPTNNADRDITGYNFQPDLAVIKCVSGTTNEDWLWADAVRTGDAANPFKGLSSSRGLGQDSVRANLVKAFNSDGFTLRNDEMVNYNAKGYVGYAWDATESFSVAANTYGSNRASSGRRNLTSGFSIVSYTGGGGANETYAHGLNTKPGVIIVKRLDTTSDWRCAHAGIIPTGGNRNFVFGPAPQSDDAAQYYTGNIYNGNITDEVFEINAADSALNASGGEYIAYCFAEVEGYCKIGRYIGGGSVYPFVWTGFRPAFVMVKGYAGIRQWIIWDSERYGYNGNNANISPPLNNTENTVVTSAAEFDMYSNGFAPKGTDADMNTYNEDFTFIAFAENPFKTARAR